MAMIQKIKHFFSKQLWSSTNEHYSKKQLFLLKQVRVVTLAFRGFKDDEVLLRSSALTFYTLISIVPVIAMAFGIAKGFGFEEKLYDLIQSSFAQQPEVSATLLEVSHSSLENTKGGLIAGFGLVMLFWSIMKVLGNIELSFNAVWGIKTPRTIIKKFTEYIAIMLIAPIFIALSSGITIYVSIAANSVLSEFEVFNLFGPAVRILIKAIPYAIIWLLFAFIYMAIPNTKVKFKHALIAGVIAGSLFNLLEWAYFAFQIGAAQKSAVYGSFAALPLFLVWVQSSWIIVLFGCEIAFSGQNVHNYVYEKEVSTISITHKRKIALLILLHMNKGFNQGENALTINNLCDTTKLPIRLVLSVINELVDAKIISEIVTQNESLTYLPARDLNGLKFSELNDIMDASGSNDVPVGNKTEGDLIHQVTSELQDSVLQNTANLTLLEIGEKMRK
ncbi:MAG: membrane protein [Saprospiraceae bacterium]|jgi:membrane protein